MDAKAKAARARTVINDEIWVLAVDETLADIENAWRSAKTPEEREALWNEQSGLRRAVKKLKKWPLEAEK